MDSSSSSPTVMQKVVDAEQGASGGVGTSILLLNDDCLFHILSLLKLRELLRMENVCERFKDVAQMIYRTYHVLDLIGENCDETPWSIEEAKEIFCRVGRYIHTLKTTEFSKSLKSDSEESEGYTVPDFIPQYCRFLRSIHLDGFDLSDLKSIENMATMCGNVKEARFRNSDLDDDNLKSMLKLNELEVLELTDIWGINGTLFISLTNIREITLKECNSVTPELFVKFCEQHPNLRSLSISECEWINNACLHSIATYLTGLEELAIPVYDIQISTQDCVALASLPKITHLTLDSLGEEDNIEQLLLNFSAHDRLEYLKIERVALTLNVEKALTKFTKLKVLNLNNSEYFHHSILDLLSCTATLQQLHICNDDNDIDWEYGEYTVTASGLKTLIARCPAIEFIDISGHEFDDSCIAPILDIIKERSHMLELKVTGDNFSEEAFGKYVGNNAFKLKLSRSENIGGDTSLDSSFGGFPYSPYDDSFDFDDLWY